MTAVYTAPKSLVQKYGGVQDLIYASLAATINHHPILGVTIEDEATPQPRWVRLENIDLRQIVNVDTDPKPDLDLDAWINSGHRLPFKTTTDLPLWRIIVATDIPKPNNGQDVVSFAVGIIYHHGIGDGISGAAFHLTFRDALNALTTSANPPTNDHLIPVPTLPLLPSLEMGTPLPIGIWFTLKIIIATFIYSPKDALLWTGPPISASAPRPPPVNIRTVILPAPTVAKLLAACRENKTTITGLITALIGRKLALAYPTYTHFAASIPISLRKFTGHTSRDMGVFVTDGKTLFSSEPTTPSGYLSCSPPPSTTTSDTSLWDSARQVKAFLSAKASTPRNHGVGLLKFVAGDFPKFFKGSLGTKRSHSFELTNVGVVEGGVGGEGAFFDRVLFSCGGCTFGPPFSFQLATAKGGDMCLNLRWEDGIVEGGIAVEVLRGVGEELGVLGA